MNICTLAFFKLLREEDPSESSLEIFSVLPSSSKSFLLTRSGWLVITAFYPKIKFRLWIKISDKLFFPKTESSSNMPSFQGHDKAILHFQYWQTWNAIWKASTAFEHGCLTQVNLESSLLLGSATSSWLRKKREGKNLLSISKINRDKDRSICEYLEKLTNLMHIKAIFGKKDMFSLKVWIIQSTAKTFNK